LEKKDITVTVLDRDEGKLGIVDDVFIDIGFPGL
jgi:hypothetical protein